MTHIPDSVLKNIFSYLHQPYDYEKKQVIDELTQRAHLIPNDFEFEDLRPQLMMPRRCKWKIVDSKYRCYFNTWSTVQCRCPYCHFNLWGIY